MFVFICNMLRFLICFEVYSFRCGRPSQVQQCSVAIRTRAWGPGGAISVTRIRRLGDCGDPAEPGPGGFPLGGRRSASIGESGKSVPWRICIRISVMMESHHGISLPNMDKRNQPKCGSVAIREFATRCAMICWEGNMCIYQRRFIATSAEDACCILLFLFDEAIYPKILLRWISKSSHV